MTGKTYEQVVKMIRGEAGTIVKLGVKGDAETREISITRVASDKLPKGPAGSHGSPVRLTGTVLPSVHGSEPLPRITHDDSSRNRIVAR